MLGDSLDGGASPPPERHGERIRSVRVDDDLWNRAKACADDRNESVGEVVRRSLRRYVLRVEREQRRRKA